MCCYSRSSGENKQQDLQNIKNEKQLAIQTFGGIQTIHVILRMSTTFE
jgi:hypothetical protein